MVAPAAALSSAGRAAPRAAPERIRGARLLAFGAAVLIHGGMAGLLLLSPAPPGTAAPDPAPILAVLAEPSAEAMPTAGPALPGEPPTPPEAAAAEPAVAPPDPAAEPEPPPADAEPMLEPPPEPPPEPELPLPAPAPDPAPPPPEPERPPPPPAEPPRPRPQPRPAPRPAQNSAAVTATATADPPPRPAAGPPPSYLQALLGALEREKRYPEAARARRATGVAILRFTVMRDGRLAVWRIERSSGDADLDRAVEAMIARARLPAMPAEMAGESLEVAVPIRFQLR